MLFNSLQFLVFFPTVVALYFISPHRYRWFVLLTASCIFYMALIPIYILVLAAAIVIDYFAGIWIEDARPEYRKPALILSVVSTCLLLFVFKYSNFFIENVNSLARFLHWNYSIDILRIVLPVGLSFHTFQSLSYVIEVYMGRQKAERNFGIYALYVMFFPQLVAGPIERPQNILPQLHAEHPFDYAKFVSGLQLMAWGFFKKVVIADRLAIMVNQVFNNVHGYRGTYLLVAVLFFSFQIYCDFSGYSDIARGAARVMGFELMVNFNRPYFAKSISEFWRRWHISLSTWFKDYLYVPLGGNRVSHRRLWFNLFFTFLVSGLWHGANWTYVVWGALNGLYLLVALWTRGLKDRLWKSAGLDRAGLSGRTVRILSTFCLIGFAWIFFRANSLHDAIYIVTHIAGPSAAVKPLNPNEFALSCALILLLLSAEWYAGDGELGERLSAAPVWARWGFSYLLLFTILSFGVFDSPGKFIYFQF